ncbi:MAG: hypothetical protein AAFP81_16960 [Pseudomonadota bacterium]
MASKIIQFRPRDASSDPKSVKSHLSAQDRTDALPEWLREHNVDWIFKAAEQRQTRR